MSNPCGAVCAFVSAISSAINRIVLFIVFHGRLPPQQHIFKQLQKVPANSSRNDHKEDEQEHQEVIIYPGEHSNGIFPVYFWNLDDCLRFISFHECDNFSLVIRYKFDTDSNHHPNGEITEFEKDENQFGPYNINTMNMKTFNRIHPNDWKSKLLPLSSIRNDDSFFLKVPQFLKSYVLRFRLEIQIDSNCHCSDFQRVEIPSILTESMHKIGDIVQFPIPNAKFMKHGVIIEMMEDQTISKLMVKIRDKNGGPNHSEIDEEGEYLVEYDRILKKPYRFQNVTDLHDKELSETRLIIKTQNNQSQAMYVSIVQGFRVRFVLKENEITTDYEEGQIEVITHFMARNIAKFLVEEDVQYRIGCVFDGSKLFMENQWRYEIGNTLDSIRRGMTFMEQNGVWDCFGYTCDICRVEVSYFDMMYHCQCKEHRHDFCVSCIDSMVQQYDSMQEFIADVLGDELDANCIQEIVAFCVGKILRYAQRKYVEEV